MAPKRRSTPYGLRDLRPLYAPLSIAIIGASPRQGSFGARTAENLAGYDGALYLVNAKYNEVNGTRCFASVAALPETPELAVLTTPANSVEQVLEECIAVGVPAVLINASGFAEIGSPDTVALQQRLAQRAAEAGVRLLGPNCVGLLNYANGARITFAGVPEGRHESGPAIGLVSQSGAIGFALAQAMDRGVGFSHVLSCGNSADVDVADWIAVLAEDPDCTAIACAFEGVADPQRFLRAAEIAWRYDKPLIVFKMATGLEGAAAAMSHTGSLAGSTALWDALFDRAGAIVVRDFEALIETAWFFAKAPAPKAPGVAMLSGSGGAAIMAGDFAELEDVALPQPSAPALAILKNRLPPFVPPRNPCDVTAGVINDLDTLVACADALLGDDNYGALIFGYTYAYETATRRQAHLAKLAEKHGKPVIFVWLTQLLEGPGTIEAERNPNLMVFRSMRGAFKTIREWNARKSRRGRTSHSAALPTNDTRDRAESLISAEDGLVMGERNAKALLAAYGLDVPREALARDEAAAARIAGEFGVPIAMKIDSPDILHKTEVGGVKLDIMGSEAARAAFGDIVSTSSAACPDARIDGVLMQDMAPQGLEIIAGFRNVPGFGPALTVGMGGVLTELLRDTVTALAPVSEREAEDMLRRLRGARLFDGFRGAPPIPLDELARAVSRISRIAADFSQRIAEFDVNPIICLPDRIIAVDALAILTSINEMEEA